MSSEANHRFAKKMLDIASSILELIKDALNALSPAIQPSVKSLRVLKVLIVPFSLHFAHYQLNKETDRSQVVA
jgi:hypothetical protein